MNAIFRFGGNTFINSCRTPIVFLKLHKQQHIVAAIAAKHLHDVFSRYSALVTTRNTVPDQMQSTT